MISWNPTSAARFLTLYPKCIKLVFNSRLKIFHNIRSVNGRLLTKLIVNVTWLYRLTNDNCLFV